MSQITAARRWLLATALRYLGTPYRWGGDDPSGFDCSGFAIECLRSVGLLSSGDYTANDLLKIFSAYPADESEAGCLLFRLDADAKAAHVAICLDQWHIIEAAGGNSSTRNNCDAWAHNAFVRIRPIASRPAKCIIVNPLAAIKE